MTFLERIPGEKFKWPKREDIDTVSQSESACFMGPINVEGSHYFTICPKIKDIQNEWIEFKRNDKN